MSNNLNQTSNPTFLPTLVFGLVLVVLAHFFIENPIEWFTTAIQTGDPIVLAGVVVGIMLLYMVICIACFGMFVVLERRYDSDLRWKPME